MYSAFNTLSDTIDISNKQKKSESIFDEERISYDSDFMINVLYTIVRMHTFHYRTLTYNRVVLFYSTMDKKVCICLVNCTRGCEDVIWEREFTIYIEPYTALLCKQIL